MKGIRFYAVMPQERVSKSASKKYPHDPFTRKRLAEIAAASGRVECFALDVSDPRWRYNPGGYGPALENDPASNCYTSCSLEWLRTRCVSISEGLARKLHPELVAHLED